VAYDDGVEVVKKKKCVLIDHILETNTVNANALSLSI
jgi:hypothetical protein